jgi:hypothetical protein
MAGGMSGASHSSGLHAGTGGQGASTGVDNTTFNVISVVYHALQGAETIQKYLRDGHGQDAKVVQFLRDAQEQNKRLAQRGQECLHQLMMQQGGGAGQQVQGGTSGGQQGAGSGGASQHSQAGMGGRSGSPSSGGTQGSR